MRNIDIQDESLMLKLGYSMAEIDSMKLYAQVASLGLVMIDLALGIMMLSTLIKFDFGMVISPILLGINIFVFIFFKYKQIKIINILK